MDRNRGPYVRLAGAVAALAVALAAAAFSHHRLQAGSQSLFELRGEMSRMHETINRGRTLASAKPPVAQRTVFSDQSGLGDLLEDLSGRLLKLDLGDRSIQTMPPVNTTHWQRFPLALSCKGGFAQTLGFLNDIEEAKLLMRVDRVAINRDPREPQTPLTLQFSLSAYARREVTP